MEQLIIPRKKHQGQLTGSCHIRIGAEHYQSILDICDKTGRPITDVANRLLDYALKHVQITDEDESYEK